ncbi:MAG: STAS/SEC14 domain-containing protein [Myxococcales bacterium]|jgi:hypothetical protein
MLERIKGLPAGVYGLRASGKVSKEDYDAVLQPMLDEARASGEGMRFLYHFGSDFDRFTPGAAWRDARVGLSQMRLFKRCAVVTDARWLREATEVAGAMLPCPVRAYEERELEDAIAWLALPIVGSSVAHRLLPDRGVVVVEVSGPLHAEDFDALSLTVDSWIESRGQLDGIVVHADEFPGWDDPGSLLRHLRFVRDHHRKIRRVALAADGAIAEHGARLAEHFVAAEIRQFGHDQLEQAIDWAAG